MKKLLVSALSITTLFCSCGEKAIHGYIPAGATPRVYSTDTSSFQRYDFVGEVEVILDNGDTMIAKFDPIISWPGKPVVVYKNLHPKLNRSNIPVDIFEKDGHYWLNGTENSLNLK